MKPERCGLKVKGIVQGIGFRPFVYKLAVSLSLKGWVTNNSDGVEIEIEGPAGHIDAFMERLKSEAPSLALITGIESNCLPFFGYKEFIIKESERGSSNNTLISPDISICGDCSRELAQKDDMRYGYPFINCTNCGPRFTIIRDIPYDRSNTTMSSFEMCDACRAQYENPADRRYHAEPVSCSKCGPRLFLLDNKGRQVDCSDPAERAAMLLSQGRILAVKGLGGYHLACDAGNKQAVSELRRRKHRDEKPFALMAGDMDIIRRYCAVRPSEEALLESPARPVVLLEKLENCSLPSEIAPGNPYLGVMLPYTPVHLLLMDRNHNCPGLLVMTSGNISSEPICYKDGEALEQLGDIADYFLTNDREIHIRTDDSVVRSFRGNEYIIRRSRGYVPVPVTVNGVHKAAPSILACGGEMKNTFCLGKGNEFYLSHHIGDLENLETLQSYEEGIEHYKRIFGISPEINAYDLHPEYLSTKYAAEESFARKIGVQHHKAHIASCMADNDIEGEVIGVSFDGTGYGEDGNLWGGEFFTGTYGCLKRAAHLEYVRMPGGSAAVREPWRMALSCLVKAGEDTGAAARILELDLNDLQLEMIDRMTATGINSPLTSSMGRLFDAVSAIAGVRNHISYEGQAAMELEFIAAKGNYGLYPYELSLSNGVYIIHTGSIVRNAMQDRKDQISRAVISAKFHETAADIVRSVCQRLSRDTGLKRVVLSGGVFQNMLLLANVFDKLEKEGLKVFIHKKVPANDGGLSLGQAMIAVAEANTL